MIKVLMRYSQEYRGEILEDEYVTYAKDEADIERKVSDLYSDPHVFIVDWEVIE